MKESLIDSFFVLKRMLLTWGCFKPSIFTILLFIWAVSFGIQSVFVYSEEFFSEQGKWFPVTSFFEQTLGFDMQVWHSVEVGFLYIPLSCACALFFILLSLDSYASERSTGALKFLLPRCSRESIYIGKLLFIMVMLLSYLLYIGCFMVFSYFMRNSSVSWDVVYDVSVLVSNIAISVLPFALLALYVSTSISSVFEGVLVVISILFLCFLFNLVFYEKLGYMVRWIVVGIQLPSQWQISSWESMALWYLPIAQSIVLFVFGLKKAKDAEI